MFGTGMTTLEIDKTNNRCHRTTNAFGHDCKKERKTPDISHLRKLSERVMRRLKAEIVKTPDSISKSIFNEYGAPNVSKMIRCKTFNTIVKVIVPKKQPVLSKVFTNKRIGWVHKYMKVYLINVLSTDEWHATVGGPDSWSSCWVVNNRQLGVRVRRQQGGRGVMCRTEIQLNILIGPHKVTKGAKL